MVMSCGTKSNLDAADLLLKVQLKKGADSNENNVSVRKGHSGV